MVNKKFLAAALAALLTFSVFGEGQKDQNGTRKPPYEKLFEGKSITAITGELYADNKLFPELKYQGKVVKIVVPRGVIAKADLTDGETVTVEGYLLAAGDSKLPPRMANQKGDFLFLTKATIKGKVYDIEKLRGEFGPGRGFGPGRKGGMMGGRFGGYGPCWDDSQDD